MNHCWPERRVEKCQKFHMELCCQTKFHMELDSHNCKKIILQGATMFSLWNKKIGNFGNPALSNSNFTFFDIYSHIQLHFPIDPRIPLPSTPDATSPSHYFASSRVEMNIFHFFQIYLQYQQLHKSSISLGVHLKQKGSGQLKPRAREISIFPGRWL